MMKTKRFHIVRKDRNHRPSQEAGNIFFMLFASVALIGVFGVATSNTLKGLVTAMSETTRKTVAEEKMTSGARLSIQGATSVQANSGDCDSDSWVEPLPFTTATGPHPEGGGWVPADIGVTEKDPWGTPYGYCAWDPGPINADAGCGGPGANRLAGSTDSSKNVVALISAGRDRQFQTTCAAIDPPVPADCSGFGGAAHYNDAASGHCYYITAATDTYSTIQSDCNGNGGYLAAITSQTENDVVFGNLSPASNSFIGAQDSAVEGVWRYNGGERSGIQFWQGNGGGTPVGGQYSNWKGGEPDDSTGAMDCAYMDSSGDWGSSDCAGPLVGICEVSGDISNNGITSTDDSDDFIVQYTYDDATGMGGEDLWKVQDTQPGVASIDKNIEVTGGASFTGAINLMEKGLILPSDPGDDSVTGACDATTDQQLRINTSSSPLALEICDFAGGGAWIPISMGSNYGEMPGGYLAWFKFDEGTGSASTVDEVGPYTGTMTGFNTATDWVTGKNGDALYFNGTSSRINFGSPATMTNLTSYSMCMWVQPDQTSIGNSEPYLIGRTSNGSAGKGAENSFHLSATPPYRIIASSRLGPYTEFARELMPAAGMWFHLCGVWDGGTAQSNVRIYVNGNLVTKTPDNGAGGNTPVDDTGYEWVIGDGTVASPHRNYKGLMDDVVIYGRALNPTDVKNLYISQGGTPTALSDSFSPPSGLVGWWRFDETGGSTAYDSSSGGNTGTLNGPVSFTAGKYGNAAYFTGNNSWIDVGSPANLDDITPITACAWVNFPNDQPFGFTNEWGMVFSKGNQGAGNSEGFALYVSDTGGVGSSADGSWRQKGSIFSTDSWHHVCSQWSGGTTSSTIGISVDGLYMSATDSTNNGGANAADAAYNFYIGRGNSTNFFYTGYIDELMVFNRILTPYEIFDVYNRTLTNAPTTGSPTMADQNFVSCKSAGSGPLRKVSQASTGEDFAFWEQNGQLFSAGNANFYALGVDAGGNVTRQTTDNFGDSGFIDVWGDGTYIYALTGSEIHALTYDGTSFTEAGSIAVSGGLNISGDGNYIYVARGTTGLTAYSFDGANFAELATHKFPGISHAWSDGQYLYVSLGSVGLYVMSFNGSGFTHVSSFSGYPTNASHGDGRYLYVNDTNGLTAYSFDGTTLTPLNTYEPGVGALITSVGVLGEQIFEAADDGELRVLSYDGLKYNTTDSIEGVGTVRDIWSNGGYLFVGSEGQGVSVYSGAECGNRTPVSQTIVATNKLARKIAAGYQSNFLIKPDGSLWSWGSDATETLGNGAGILDSATMVRVGGDKSWKEVSAGNGTACGIDINGKGWCWGSDNSGALGDGGGMGGTQPSPVAVNVGTDTFTQISVGYDNYACGIKSDGSLWCWGSDSSGKLGNGAPTANQASPTAVVEPGPWVQVAAGRTAACGIKADGSLWCWGSNSQAQLGLGYSGGGNFQSPVPVVEPGPWVYVSSDNFKTYAIKQDGTLWGWGSVLFDRYGTGNGSFAAGIAGYPVRAGDPGPWLMVTSTAGSSRGSVGLKQDGTAWGWGWDEYFALGLPTDSTYYQPTQILDPGPWAWLDLGSEHACGLKIDGSAWCWGRNQVGQIGTGVTGGADIEVPTPVLNAGLGAPFRTDNASSQMVAMGTGQYLIGTTRGISYDGSNDAGGLGNGISFPTSGTVALRRSPGNLEWKMETPSSIVSPTVTWGAQSAATTRSLGIDYSGKNLEIGNNNAAMNLYMDNINTTQIDIAPTGYVGIKDVDVPQSRLHIGGGLRIGSDSDNCMPARNGTLRYVGGISPFQYCNGTGWVTF